MIIAGVDPGLGCTAWSVLEVTRTSVRFTKLLAMGETKRRANCPLAVRLWEIFDCIDTMLCGWKPIIVGVEAGYIGPNRRTAGFLALARGAAIAAVGSYSSDAYVEVMPQDAKLEVGSGRASKEDVRRGMQLLLLKDAMSYDEADASAIALAAENLQWRAGKYLNPPRGMVR